MVLVVPTVAEPPLPVRNVSVSPVAIVTLKFVLSGVVAPATVQP